MARSESRHPYDLHNLIDLRTDSTPDQTRVRIQGSLYSGIQCVQSIRVARVGSALLLTIEGNLPYLAGRHASPLFDSTFDIPEGVNEIQVGTKREILWRRGDCLKRFQDHGGKWHCDEKT